VTRKAYKHILMNVVFTRHDGHRVLENKGPDDRLIASIGVTSF